jgi:hypothetical protein
MEEYLRNFKGIAKDRGLPPLNPMECGILQAIIECASSFIEPTLACATAETAVAQLSAIGTFSRRYRLTVWAYHDSSPSWRREPTR